MKTVTVEANVTVVTTEKRSKSFPSLKDPPVHCCRCFPNSISAMGFCGCCEFDHATGERMEPYCDPDFDAKPFDPEDSDD